MLDQEIEQSRARRLEKLRWYVLIGVISVSALGAGVVILSNNIPTVDNAGTEVVEATPPVNNIPQTNSPANQEEQRKRFQEQLVIFETGRQPLLETKELSRWDSPAVTAIHEKKSDALTQFASGKYRDAIATLEEANKDALSLEHRWQAAYRERLYQAQQAYQKEDVEQSQLLLNQAFDIQAPEAEGLLLQKQLDSYPRVAKLLQQLNVARVENNVSKQVSLLKEITAADPSRKELVAEYQQLKQKWNNQLFSQHISRGLNALDQGQLNKAVEAYGKAKRIYPQRSELSALQKKITQQQNAIDYKTIIAQLENAAKADDWLTVQKLSQAAFTNNQLVMDYRNEATHILKLQQQADHYIRRPERLLDAGIRASAQEFVKSNIKTTLKSPHFSRQIKTLSELLATADAEYALSISSDGNTDIWVLGVGHVGKIQQKTVLLPLGQYTLEGRCEGYRNKQIVVSLDKQQEVTLVCDERIR